MLIFIAFTYIGSQALAGENAAEQFTRIKALAGEWQGKNTEGKNVKVSYEVFSNGSVVVEKLMPENEPNMLTMYHLDGDKLMMTHYCAAQNQPRMLAEANSKNPSQIRFSFLDATNLAKETDGHMHKLMLTFTDGNTLKQQWTWMADNEEKVVGFELTRVEYSKK